MPLSKWTITRVNSPGRTTTSGGKRDAEAARLVRLDARHAPAGSGQNVQRCLVRSIRAVLSCHYHRAHRPDEDLPLNPTVWRYSGKQG
jgi:hypothetical protein